MRIPRGFTYASGKLEQAIEDLVGSEEIEEAIHRQHDNCPQVLETPKDPAPDGDVC